MLVSFIIPAYNAAGTIVRCLDSIRNLSLDKEDYEIIVIDDASTDNTLDVIEDWKNSIDDRLTILSQSENHRQGAARNRGVKVARGEYICFVDSDDAVTEGIVKAIRLAKGKKTDMTVLHYAFVNESGAITQDTDKLSFAEGQLFSGIEMQNTHPYWCSGPVAYVYNREFLERVNYPFVEGVLFEDSDFVVVHLFHAKRMTYSAELGYKAYYREGSTTRSMNYKNVADYLLLGVRMMRFYERIMSEGVKELMSEGVKDLMSEGMKDLMSEEVQKSCLEGAKNELMSEREKFAEGILEGTCWNVQKSCRRLIKLGGIKEVRAYYDRINEHIVLYDIYKDARYRKYYWNAWTSLCVGHGKLAMMILAVLIPVYKLVKQ